MEINLEKALKERAVTKENIQSLQQWLCSEYRLSFDDLENQSVDTCEELAERLANASCIKQEVDNIMIEVYARQGSFVF